MSWDEVGEVVAGVEEAFASGYTIVDRALKMRLIQRGYCLFKKRNMRYGDNNNK